MDMSASDDEAGAPTTASASPRGRRGGSSKVKSSARVDSSSDENDGQQAGETKKRDENPYPVEGIYKDDAERRL